MSSMRVNIEKLVLAIKHMANKSIEKSSKRCFWAAIMAIQTGIRLMVIWLKCTENGRSPPVVSNSLHVHTRKATHYNKKVPNGPFSHYWLQDVP